MTLKDTLYRIETRYDGDGDTTFAVLLLRDCFIFRAHFPERPVMPGVCLVQMAVELLEERFGERLAIRRIKNVKFLSVISPDDSDRLLLRLSHITTDVTSGTVAARIDVTDALEQKAKISLELEKSRPER